MFSVNCKDHGHFDELKNNYAAPFAQEDLNLPYKINFTAKP